MSLGFFSDLREKNLEAIRRHKYTCVGESMLEPILRPWWRLVGSAMPASVAPNTITLTGLTVLVTATILVAIFSQEFSATLPPWVNIYAAVALFCYQTMDAIDGMQARRLGLVSPLGEVFDHGCDALALFLVVINVGASVRAQASLILFKASFWSVFFALYCTHWGYYVTGNFYFTKFNVTEAQICAILTHIVSAIFSDSIFYLKIFGEFDIYTIICFLVLAVNLMSIPYFLYFILTNGKGKNGSSVANTSILSPVIPIIIIFSFWVYIENNSHLQLFTHHPIEMLLITGFAIGTISTKLLFCTMAQTPFLLSDISILNMFVLTISVKFKSATLERVCFYAVVILEALWCLASFINISLFLSHKFNIPIFGVKKSN